MGFFAGQGTGQMAGGPADQPITNTGNIPGQMVGGPADQPVFGSSTFGPGQMAGGPADLGNMGFGKFGPIGGPAIIGSGGLPAIIGLDQNMNMGQMAGGPAGQPIINPVAQQTQQRANNPVYGQTSPFQPPMPLPGNPQIGFGPAPIQTPEQKAQIAAQTQFFTGGQGIGQLAGGPAGQPIVNNPQQGQLSRIARPGLDQGGPQFAGGLRPAPRNYRPPMRRFR